MTTSHAIQCRRCGEFTNKLLIQGEWTRVCSCNSPTRRTPIPLSPDKPRYQQIAEMRATGMSVTAISLGLNICHQAVYDALKRAKRKGLV